MDSEITAVIFFIVFFDVLKEEEKKHSLYMI